MSRYDRHFGGKGSAAKAMAAMKAEHGADKGEEAFYATMNKRKKRKAMMRGAKHGR